MKLLAFICVFAFSVSVFAEEKKEETVKQEASKEVKTKEVTNKSKNALPSGGSSVGNGSQKSDESPKQ